MRHKDSGRARSGAAEGAAARPGVRPTSLHTTQSLPAWAPVVGLLCLCAVLAVSSLLGDSLTFDELAHLTGGVGILLTGDFRMDPENPPLASLWAALPVAWIGPNWPPADSPEWRNGHYFAFGRLWFYEYNRGEALLAIARCMMVLLLVGVCGTIYFAARRMLGPRPALLSLAVASLSPTLLAHGRLVNSDVPVALCVLLCLLSWALLLECVTPLRWLACAASLAALLLVKFSGVLLLPALAAMAAFAVFRPRSIAIAVSASASTRRLVNGRVRRALLVTALCASFAASTWAAIWSVYTWRYEMFAGGSRDTAAHPNDAIGKIHAFWDGMLTHAENSPGTQLLPGAIRWARSKRLLPEAYLYGFTYTAHTTQLRHAYLMGEYSTQGWRSYFPIAFTIKTPLPTLALLVIGAAVLARRRGAVPRDPTLWIGMLTFAAVYGVFSVLSKLNIGHRHLLPIYPLVFVVAGASAAWGATRIGRVVIAGALLWLAGSVAWIHPHYLAYFNEIAGGPARGSEWLADSNLDWGQDLKRLAAYARAHPDERIKLAYFGSADPRAYLDCDPLLSFAEFRRPGEHVELGHGAYVISVTQLLGVYHEEIREAFWAAPRAIEAYAAIAALASSPPTKDESDELAAMREQAQREFPLYRQARLINRLKHRTPDARIGYSMFVYRLTQADVDALTAP